MTTQLAFLAVIVSDLDRARQFYTHALQLPESSQQRPGAVVYDAAPHLQLAIRTPQPHESVAAPQGLGFLPWFQVPDLATAVQRLQANGHVVPLPHQPTPFGASAIALDPDGHRLVPLQPGS